MDTAPAEGHASVLRQRMLNRASTIAEGAQPSSPSLSRRRSSLFSNLSDAQHSFRSSNDNLLRTNGNNDMDKLTSSDDPSWWHSGPVLIAIVPAVAALTHPSGGTLATDIVLIVLSAWFMSKCVAVPWEWYHEARQRQYVDIEEPAYDDTIYEDDEDSMGGSPERPASATNTSEEPKVPPATASSTISDAQKSARAELRRTELMAFAACFLGPLLGAYLLHNIRSQFTHRTRDGIVTDLNLTIYILGAEMRPISRLMRMVNERTLHLQRVVMSGPKDQSRPATAEGLPQRLAELEARLDGPMYNSNSNVDITKISAEVRQSMQHQLDALNRAVRKYEKRHMAQSIQIEARFQEIDVRLKDTLSLAAAAARTGQKPGIISMTISWIAGIFTYSVQMTWDIAMYPFRTASSLVAVVSSWIFKDERTTRKRTRGQLNGYSSLSATPRMQSKSGR
jgi:hypothetical protein